MCCGDDGDGGGDEDVGVGVAEFELLGAGNLILKGVVFVILILLEKRTYYL